MSSMSWRLSASRAISICIVSILCVACQQETSGTAAPGAPPDSTTSAPPAETATSAEESTNTGTSTPGTDEHHGDQPATTGTANIQLEGPATEISAQLGEKKVVTLSVQPLGEFSGPVQLSIDKADLDSVYKAGADIKFTITPSQIMMNANEAQIVQVEVHVTSRAPSFTSTAAGGSGHFAVVGQADFGGQAITASMDVPLSVTPVYEVHILKNGVPHSYDQPTMGEVATTEIRNHSGGVTVRFVNYDTAESHVMHGSGLIPHQSTGSPMAKAPAEGQAGGTYLVRVTSTTKTTGQYYCHNHESSALRRVILFNADL